MNNVVALAPQRGLREYNSSQLSLIRKTVAKDCNADEFDLFVEVCKRVGLDPFRKQIYAIVTNKDKADKRQLVIVTGIDGYRAIASRNGDYRPDDKAPRYTIDENAKNTDSNPLGIVCVEVSAYKHSADGWYEIVGTAFWDEFAPLTEDGKWEDTGEVWGNSGKPKKSFVGNGKFTLDPRKSNWRKMARVMIAKCAEAQALRKGWPEDLSGVYLTEEIDQAEAIDMTATKELEAADEERRLRAINANGTVSMQWAAGEPIEFVPLGQIADRCLGFIKECDSAAQLIGWRNINQMGLREFWAKAPSDALAVKQKLESEIERLSTVVDQEVSDDQQ